MNEALSDTKTSLAKRILLTLLGFVIVLTGVIGALFFGIMVYGWIDGGFDFVGINTGIFFLNVGVYGTFILLCSIFLSGIFLRLITWQKAPILSLIISIASIVVILLSDLIYSRAASSFKVVLAFQGIGFLLFLIVSLPLFLHWRRARIKVGSI